MDTIKNDMGEWLPYPTQSFILVYLFRKKAKANLTELSRKSEHITYSSVWKNVSILQGRGLVRSQHKGRVRYIYITKKGERLAKLLIEIKKIIDRRSKR